jgi:sec-independent protein translocase protein TatB
MNILGMGPMEILLIVVLALIVFGPAKLPEIMRQVGKAINDFRRATSDLSDEFNRTIQAELKEGRSLVDETRSTVTNAHASVTSAISGLPAPTRTAAASETPPVPSGTGPEAPINGTVPGQPSPPLADTNQWTWETAAPPPPRPAEVQAAEPTSRVSSPVSISNETGSVAASDTQKPAAETVVAYSQTSATSAVSEPSPARVVSAESAPSESSATHVDPPPRSPASPARSATRRTARDELLPPY